MKKGKLSIKMPLNLPPIIELKPKLFAILKKRSPNQNPFKKIRLPKALEQDEKKNNTKFILITYFNLTEISNSLI